MTSVSMWEEDADFKPRLSLKNDLPLCVPQETSLKDSDQLSLLASLKQDAPEPSLTASSSGPSWVGWWLGCRTRMVARIWESVH